MEKIFLSIAYGAGAALFVAGIIGIILGCFALVVYSLMNFGPLAILLILFVGTVIAFSVKAYNDKPWE